MPVEAIVGSVFNLRVCDIEDMSTAPGAPAEAGNNLSGMLLTGSGEIWVKAEEGRRWPGRRRFTIGHELGHWVMHRTGEQSRFCRTAAIAEAPAVPEQALETTEPTPAAIVFDGKPPKRAKPPLIESEADVFAASLLMPAHLVKARYEHCNGEIERMMADFKCSQKAITYRVLHVIPKDRRRERRPA